MSYNEKEHHYIGVDGGGSKTVVRCVSQSGEIVGEGYAGPTGLSSADDVVIQRNMQFAVTEAIKNLSRPVKIKRAVIGLAGFDTPDEHTHARELLIPAFNIVDLQSWTIVNDSYISLVNGTKKQDAIVVISGTGSNCFGKNSMGDVARAGGMDYLLSDEGSGYAVGRAVLRAVVRSYDERGAKTILESMVSDYFEINSVLKLKNKVYNPPIEKNKVAKLATLCTQAAEKGDLVAQEICAIQIAELVLMVSTVAKKLDLFSRPFDLVLTGGFLGKKMIKERFIAMIKEEMPNCTPILPKDEPVNGAVYLALKGN